MRTVLWTVASLAVLPFVLAALAIIFGGPGQPDRMAALEKAFAQADYSDIPEPSFYSSGDGTKLAYRAYKPTGGKAPTGSVILIHGSSATSRSIHPLAAAMAAAGYQAYALDMRGHGQSGARGLIAYEGQLEDDLQAFVQKVSPAAPRTLTGFSSGGGFALRVAAGPRKSDFQGYLLLSPFLHQTASTQRPDSGGWARVGVPRLVALALLQRLGIHVFDDLPVTRFAVAPENSALLTETYNLALSANFRPRADYRSDIAHAVLPLAIVAGDKDQAFYAERFASEFQGCPGLRHVRIVPDIDHATLTVDPRSISEVIRSLRSLNPAVTQATNR